MVAIRADKYFNNKQKIDMFYAEVCPVDLNAGLVAPKMDRWGVDESLGDHVQANIRERFALETPGGDDENE